VRARILEGRTREFTIDGTGAVRFHSRLCATKVSGEGGHFEGGISYPLHVVSGPEIELLVEKNESGCGQLCVILWRLSASKG
jgi:hypothetical protein